MSRIIYFGPPGTGKTQTLLTRLEEALQQGASPDRIAFLTFTRRARAEAVARVEQVLGIEAKDLPYFRTIHSMAFRALNLQEGDVLGYRELAEFGTLMGGLTFGANAAEYAADGLQSQSKGDHLLAIDNLARLQGVEPRVIYSEAKSPYDWTTVDWFCTNYRVFKQEQGLLDFTDVLDTYYHTGPQLPIDVAFVDEAQDLSALQWRVVLKATASAEQEFIAGDDDQAIYRWAGAQVEALQELEGERVVLAHSYRLPRSVHACASKILQRIKHRVPKEFEPRDADGLVCRHAGVDSLCIEDKDQWLWLVRNRYLMNALREHLMAAGRVFTMHGTSSIVSAEREDIYAWERLRAGKSVSAPAVRDLYARLRGRVQIKQGHKLLPDVADDASLTLAELQAAHGLLVTGPWHDVFVSIPAERRAYYRRLLRHHGTLKIEPQVMLETIHGAKGAQASKVALFLEQSKRTHVEAMATPDEEHRVWYVGATRAREELHVIASGGRYEYAFPS